MTFHRNFFVVWHFFSFLWHFGLLWIQWILFYTTFTDVIERRDFTAIFSPIFQEATVIFNSILPWFSYIPTHAPPVFAGFVFVDPCSRLVNMGQRVPIITHDEIVGYPSNWHQLPMYPLDLHCTACFVVRRPRRAADTSTKRLPLQREHGTGCRHSGSCCGRPLLFVVNWKHSCPSLPTDIGKIDDCFVMRLRSSVGGAIQMTLLQLQLYIETIMRIY